MAARVDHLLKQSRSHYPKMLRVVGDMRATVRAAGTTWPEWCWTPLAAFHAFVVSRGGNPATDVGRTAALAMWELGRGVYVPDAEVAEVAYNSLRQTATAGPVDWHRAALPELTAWTRLPQWCCYLALPPELADLDVPDDVFRPRGVFVHLESDANTGRPELRLLLDTTGTWDGLHPIPVYVDRPTLGAAIADMGAVNDAVAAGVFGADLRAVGGLDEVTNLRGLAVWMVLPYVLALLDADARLVDPDLPGDEPAPAQPDHQGRWLPAKRTRIWHITYRTPGRHLRLA
jgi:hypothetical protein